MDDAPGARRLPPSELSHGSAAWSSSRGFDADIELASRQGKPVEYGRPVSSHRLVALRSGTSAFIGGVAAWVAIYAGARAWGFVIGAAVTAALAMSARRRANPPPPRWHVAGFTFAFVALTWPLLFLVTAVLWWLVTGQSVGD